MGKTAIPLAVPNRNHPLICPCIVVVALDGGSQGQDAFRPLRRYSQKIASALDRAFRLCFRNAPGPVPHLLRAPSLINVGQSSEPRQLPHLLRQTISAIALKVNSNHAGSLSRDGHAFAERLLEKAMQFVPGRQWYSRSRGGRDARQKASAGEYIGVVRNAS